MKIMFDIDGVIMDFTNCFIPWHNTKYPNDPIKDEWDNYSFGIKQLPSILDRIHKFGDDNMYLQMLPIKNAVKVFNEISENHQIYVVTNTSQQHLTQRVMRLKELGFKVQRIVDIVSTNDKAKFVLEECISVCIEDSPKHIKELSSKAGGNATVFVPPYKYNEGLADARVKYYDDLEEIPKLIEEVVNGLTSNESED